MKILQNIMKKKHRVLTCAPPYFEKSWPFLGEKALGPGK